MNAKAAIAQTLWAAGNLVEAKRFAAALRNPEETQTAWLRQRIAADADSEFGRAHDFSAIQNHRDFAQNVPLREWRDFSPWIDRIRAGEKHVLGAEPVSHLAPTSGSSGARKLIPFTPALHRSFAAAVGAWMSDLARREPKILLGPVYWSISPLTGDEEDERGGVRVGFADDADYLGGWQARLARWAMAVPSEIRHEQDIDVFWFRTAASLLARRDLRLISVWHPSFLDLILRAAARDWDRLLATLPKRRAAELRRASPDQPSAWWPALRVISCWGEQAAAPGRHELARKFPACLVQAKGLLATEAVVTIPWRGQYPLAIRSHFFEFLSEAGDILLAHELERGKTYEVIVTNGGGLWRYRLGDMIECTGHCERTPTLRFLGRAGNVSDLCGEKLSEPFVAGVLDALWPDAARRPETAWLRPFSGADGAGYELVVSRPVLDALLEALDHRLRENPHYDLARRLGQLLPPRACIEPDTAPGSDPDDPRRLGDIKPLVLQVSRQLRCHPLHEETENGGPSVLDSAR